MRSIGHDSSDGQGSRPLGEGVASDLDGEETFGEDGFGEALPDDSAFGEGDLSTDGGPTGSGDGTDGTDVTGVEDTADPDGDWFEDGDSVLFAEAGEADADESTAGEGGFVEELVDTVTGLFDGGEDAGPGGDAAGSVDFLE